MSGNERFSCLLRKLQSDNRYAQSAAVKEIAVYIQEANKNDLQELLELLICTHDLEIQVKIFSVLAVYLLNHGINCEIIVKYNPLYETIQNLLISGPTGKATAALNFILALLCCDDGGSLATHARNLIRLSGCLNTMAVMFSSNMMFQDTWVALIQSLAEAVHGSEVNQTYCSHLVPLCVQTCRRGDVDVCSVLQSLLNNHNRNIQLFIECQGQDIFTRQSLQYNMCIQLLNTVVENSAHADTILRNTDILYHLQDFLSLYGPHSQMGQWSTIILYHLNRGSGGSSVDSASCRPKLADVARDHDMRNRLTPMNVDCSSALNTDNPKKTRADFVNNTSHNSETSLAKGNYHYPQPRKIVFNINRQNPTSDNNRPNAISDYNRPNPVSDCNSANHVSGFNRSNPATDLNRPNPVSDLNRPNPASNFNRPTPASDYNRPNPVSDFNRPNPLSDFNGPNLTFEFIRPNPASDYNIIQNAASAYNKPNHVSDFNRPNPVSDFTRSYPVSDFNRQSHAADFNIQNPASDYNRPNPVSNFNRPNTASGSNRTNPDDTNNLFQNVINEVIYWKSKGAVKRPNGTPQLNLNVKPQFDQNTHHKLQTQNKLDQTQIKNIDEMDFTFSFLIKENEQNTKKRTDFDQNDKLKDIFLDSNTLNKRNDGNANSTEKQRRNNNLYDTRLHNNDSVIDLTNFKPPFISTPKRYRSEKMHAANMSHMSRVSKKYVNKRKTFNKQDKSINTSMEIKQRSMGSRLFSAINDSCTTIVKSMKSIFRSTNNKNNINDETAKEKTNDDSCSYSFTNYMRERDTLLEGEFSNEESSSGTYKVNSCKTCRDTIILQQKMARDDHLKRAVRKLKMGINLYGCDFKRISKMMWPRDKYMTANMLRSLYRKLIVKGGHGDHDFRQRAHYLMKQK